LARTSDNLVGGFCAAVRRLLAEHQAQEVKTIGDALMLRTGDAAAAIRLGCPRPPPGGRRC
jgi:class 3 adenylate cyclase